jgi:hypothetical protein
MAERLRPPKRSSAAGRTIASNLLFGCIARSLGRRKRRRRGRSSRERFATDGIVGAVDTIDATLHERLPDAHQRT